MSTIKEDINELKKMIQTLHDKLFIGNGQPPITVQIDRLNTFKKLSYWFYSAMFVTAVSLLARLTYVIFKA